MEGTFKHGCKETKFCKSLYTWEKCTPTHKTPKLSQSGDRLGVFLEGKDFNDIRKPHSSSATWCQPGATSKKKSINRDNEEYAD